MSTTTIEEVRKADGASLYVVKDDKVLLLPGNRYEEAILSNFIPVEWAVWILFPNTYNMEYIEEEGNYGYYTADCYGTLYIDHVTYNIKISFSYHPIDWMSIYYYKSVYLWDTDTRKYKLVFSDDGNDDPIWFTIKIDNRGQVSIGNSKINQYVTNTSKYKPGGNIEVSCSDEDINTRAISWISPIIMPSQDEI